MMIGCSRPPREGHHEGRGGDWKSPNALAAATCRLTPGGAYRHSMLRTHDVGAPSAAGVTKGAMS